MMNWLIEHFGWMRWNWPSAIFFVTIFGAICGLTIWDIVSPGTPRRRFLPMATTRGDRLFLCIMLTIGVFLLWLATFGNQSLLVPAVLISILNSALARWG